MANLTLAFRTLFKSPFVTAVAIVSLALGIGANAAIFSLFNQMLLRPIPARAPEQLINLSAPGPKPGSNSCSQAGPCSDVFSYPMYRDLERAAIPQLAGIAAHRGFASNLAYRGQTLNGEGVLVSGTYFPVLGLTPALGRLLSPSDDQTIGAHTVAVLSHSYWEVSLGSDPAVVGQTLVVNGRPMTIVGVAPKGFEGTTLGSTPKVYVPLSMRAAMEPNFHGFTNRRSYWVYVFARAKPGVTIEQARTALNGVYRPIIRDVELPLQSKGIGEAMLNQFRDKELGVSDGSRGQSSTHAEVRMPLILLMSITGIVLLIACANIANLLLARGANRAMEMAVRLSLGATRGQLLRQLLTESCLLAVLGGVVSLLVAHWTLAMIGSILPDGSTGMLQLELQLPVTLFAGALAIGTGFLFGLFPALHSTRPDLVSIIRANTGQPSGALAASRFRTGLVTAQIALSMALLISAGLFVKSLANVSRVDLGVKIENLVTFGISPELNGYEPARSAVLLRRVEDELAALPGVTGVTQAMIPILSGSNWGTDVDVQGFESGPGIDNNARLNEVAAGYFRVLGIPLLAGREFTRADAPGAPRVAVVNEEFVKKFNLGRDAVGKRMSTDGPEKLDIEIVGVVRDAKYAEVKQKIPPMFFTPYVQDSTVGATAFYVRTANDPAQTLRAIPGVVRKLDANLPVENLKTMPQQVKDNVALDRMISALSAAFAALATLLAAVGLYGVLAYTVAQRTREIGVRMALGADAGRVRGMVLRQVGMMTLIGGVIGLVAALALGRAAASLLYELNGHDPVVFVLAALVLALVASGAGYFPARRASRVDPMQALRYE